MKVMDCGMCDFTDTTSLNSHEKNIFVYFFDDLISKLATRKSYSRNTISNHTRKLNQRKSIGKRCAHCLVGWLFISINFRMKSIGRNRLASMRSLRVLCSKFQWISFVAAVETDFNPVKKIYGEFIFV